MLSVKRLFAILGLWIAAGLMLAACQPQVVEKEVVVTKVVEVEVTAMAAPTETSPTPEPGSLEPYRIGAAAVTQAGNPNIFRVAPTDAVAVTAYLEYLDKLGVTKLAMLYAEDTYSKGGAEAFSSLAPNYGKG
jgi:ABC-type branched-subunit amino acid transport system substrate-binding protein